MSTSSIIVTKASALNSSAPTAQSKGMIRQSAIQDLDDSISASLMIAPPHTPSAIHHHAQQSTVVYAISGKGTLVSEGGKKRQTLEAGDWALIPAGVEHQEINEGDEEVRWVIVRSGRVPEVVNLEGWGGEERK
ncbi:MAG: hypothetical protein MMC33_000717 [Icmadophila ericetorum]|nr:hypothetical protein [Icmadophila ericetorum]